MKIVSMFYNSSLFQHFLQLVSTIFSFWRYLNSSLTKFLSDILLPFPNSNDLNSGAFREGADCYHLLYAFGRDALSDEMIPDAVKFLLKCITKHDVDTFDELRFFVYHENYLEFDTERFPPTSDDIRQHMLHAYLQCYIWLHYTFLENIDLVPLDHGDRLTEDSTFAPIISTKPSIPSNFPQSCNFQKIWQNQCLQILIIGSSLLSVL